MPQPNQNISLTRLFSRPDPTAAPPVQSVPRRRAEAIKLLSIIDSTRSRYQPKYRAKELMTSVREALAKGWEVSEQQIWWLRDIRDVAIKYEF